MTTIEDLQDALEDLFSDGLPSKFKIELDENNQVIIYTGLVQDEDGDLLEYHSEDDEDNEDEDYGDDDDSEYDEDLESLDEEDDDDE